MELIRPGTKIDFVGKRKIFAVLSFFVVAASIFLFFVPGPSWGIDFTGGTEIHIKFTDPVDIGDVRDALGSLELGGDAVQRIGQAEDAEYVIRIQDPTFGTDEVKEQVEQALGGRFGGDWVRESTFDAQIGARMTVRYAGPAVTIRDIQSALSGIEGAVVSDSPDDNTVYVKLPGISSKVEEAIRTSLSGRDFEVLQVDSVGPKVGGELRTQGFISILTTLALVLIYVAFRFDLTFAPGAVIALFHDVTITVGVFVLLEMTGISHNEFNLPMVGALLTIVGYSLNDTIVIYDRIRENMKRYRRRDTANLINSSINETLGRTLATSLTTMMAMVSFLVLGGPVIKTFAIAILVGIFVGTYSTIYIASPTILLMEDLRPYLSKLVSPLSAAAAFGGEGSDSGPSTASQERRRHRQSQANRPGEDSSDEG